MTTVFSWVLHKHFHITQVIVMLHLGFALNLSLGGKLAFKRCLGVHIRNRLNESEYDLFL